jgi:hypothetical protein
MKRIEIVMSSRATDSFRDVAANLGISEFDVAAAEDPDPYQRKRPFGDARFMGQPAAKSKVEFRVADEQAMKIFHVLVTTLQLDSISVFKIDKTVTHEGRRHAVAAALLAARERSPRVMEIPGVKRKPEGAIVGFRPRFA